MADKFNRAAEFILDRVSKAKSAPFGGTSGGSSVADELAKLAALLEKGYLSKEEFDTQKRTILARDETPQVPDGEPLVFSEPDESQRPQDRIDEVIAEELHKREAEQKGAQSTRPTFGRRPPRP